MKITIDTKVWATQTQYADEKKISRQLISAWIRRGNIKHRIIPELGNLVLVKRGSETPREYKSR